MKIFPVLALLFLALSSVAAFPWDKTEAPVAASVTSEDKEGKEKENKKWIKKLKHFREHYMLNVVAVSPEDLLEKGETALTSSTTSNTKRGFRGFLDGGRNNDPKGALTRAAKDTKSALKRGGKDITSSVKRGGKDATSTIKGKAKDVTSWVKNQSSALTEDTTTTAITGACAVLIVGGVAYLLKQQGVISF